jgi:hypothetical protein
VSGPTPPWHPRLSWVLKNRGPNRLPEWLPTAPTIGQPFPENQRRRHRRRPRGWRVRMRDAELSRRNCAASQVQASKGPEVPLHFWETSLVWQPPGLLRAPTETATRLRNVSLTPVRKQAWRTQLTENKRQQAAEGNIASRKAARKAASPDETTRVAIRPCPKKPEFNCFDLLRRPVF